MTDKFLVNGVDLSTSAVRIENPAGLLETQHRGGVPWFKAPPPARRGHRHTPHTVGWVGLEIVWRCTCGAISRRGHDGWLYLDPPRFASERTWVAAMFHVEPQERRM